MGEQDQPQDIWGEAAAERSVDDRWSDEVLTARQAAQLLKISTDLLYEAANRGELPHRRVGRRMLFSRLALLAWLQASPTDSRPWRRARARHTSAGSLTPLVPKAPNVTPKARATAA